MIELLEELPDAEKYFSDNARIYRECWLKKFSTGKSKITNIVESFNSFLRAKNPYLEGFLEDHKLMQKICISLKLKQF